MSEKGLGSQLKEIGEVVGSKVAILALGKRWWVVGPEGAGKTTFHSALVGIEDLGIHSPTIGRAETAGGTTLSKTRSGDISTRRVKSSSDVGGHVMYWDVWSEALTPSVDRLVFLYDLSDVSHGANAWQNLEAAFDAACEAIEDRYAPKGKVWRRKPRARTLLVMANKADVWSEKPPPSQFDGNHFPKPEIYSQALDLMKTRAGQMTGLVGVQPIWTWGSVSKNQPWYPSFEAILERVESHEPSRWAWRRR